MSSTDGHHCRFHSDIIRTLRSRIETLCQCNDYLSRTTENAVRDYDKSMLEVIDLRAKNAELQVQLDAANAKCDEQVSLVEFSSMVNVAEKLTLVIFDLRAKNAELQERADTAQAKCEKVEAELNTLKNYSSYIQSDRISVLERRNELYAENRKLRKKLKQSHPV